MEDARYQDALGFNPVKNVLAFDLTYILRRRPCKPCVRCLTLENAFGVSLPLGQENLSAAQAKRTDGADALSAVWGGQSVTPKWLCRCGDCRLNRIGAVASRLLVANHQDKYRTHR
jgi:hypothetical protein